MLQETGVTLPSLDLPAEKPASTDLPGSSGPPVNVTVSPEVVAWAFQTGPRRTSARDGKVTVTDHGTDLSPLLRTVSQPMKPSPQLAPVLYVAVSTTGAAEDGVGDGVGLAEDRSGVGLGLALALGRLEISEVAARLTFAGRDDGGGVGVSITAAGTTEAAVVGTTSLGELSFVGPADRIATQATIAMRSEAARMISE